MFVLNTWYVAAKTSEIDGTRPLARTLLSQPVVLFRIGQDRFVALEDRCCHRFAPLSMGDVEEDGLRCRYHGMKFDGQGRCIEIPGQAEIPAAMCVKRYPLANRHGLLWIWMGDPAKADESLIIDCHWNVDPQWGSTGGYLHYEANFQLIVDNLLDFSHLTFLHRSTLANKNFAVARPEVTTFDRGIRLRRTIHDSEPSPIHREGGKFNVNVDFWTWQDFVVPTAFHNWAGSAPVGGEIPHESRPDAFQLHHFSLLTPETERTTHYFWIQSAQFPHQEWAEGVRKMGQGIDTAFAEDKWIIEAQQKLIDADPKARMQGTRHDFALNQVRFMTRRLVDAESVVTP